MTVCMAAAGFADAAAAQQSLISEVRVGLYDHDTDLFGHKKESGADFVAEAVSQPIGALGFIGAPRFLIGAAVNSAGQTNQIYVGLARTWNLVENVMRRDDAIFLEGTLGGTLHDGKIDVLATPEGQRWKSHGSQVLFRENIALGYRFSAKYSLSLNLTHISNAGIAHRNEGMNNIGLNLGITLGSP